MKIKLVQDIIDVLRGKKIFCIRNKKILFSQPFREFSSAKGKNVLLVFPNNFYNANAGNNVYTLAVVEQLKALGFCIDFLATTKLSEENAFDDFEEQNLKHGKLINAIHLYHHKKSGRKKYPYSNCSQVDDDFLAFFHYVLSLKQYDFIYIHYVQFMDLIRFSAIPETAKIIHHMHDCFSLQKFYSGGRLSDFTAFFEEEIGLLRYCDEIIYISNDERMFFSRFLPDKKSVFLPHFLNAGQVLGAEKEYDCLFVGSQNFHNKNSLVWFFTSVYPLLNSKISVAVCGKVCDVFRVEYPLLYETMQKNRVTFIRYAENLDDVFAKTKISIVPMISGTGLKIKTVEAMSYGLPVVTTSLGVDGFADKKMSACLVEDTAEGFAAKIDLLLNDRVVYNEVSAQIKRYFAENFSVECNKNVLSSVFMVSEDNNG